MDNVNMKTEKPNVVGTINCQIEVISNVDKELVETRNTMKKAVLRYSQFNEKFAEKHPLRILIADDSMVNVKVTLWFLKKLGYKPDVAFNGVEVLDALKRRSFDVIFMDAEMPEMDGVETTIAIRQTLPSEKQPHIIAMSANSSGDDIEKYLSAGMNDHIKKPLQMDEIVQALLAVRQLPDFLNVLYSKESDKQVDKLEG